MPREAIVDLPCRVKHELGGGSLRAGSRGLVNLLRAREVAALVRARPRQDGRAVESISVKMMHLAESGVEEVAHTVGELEAQATRLDPLVPYCTNCPANALRRSFGCVGGLPYPIRRAVEVYALGRVTGNVGGALLQQTLIDRGFDGAGTREHRVEGKFQALPGPSRKLDDGRMLTADQLFEPLMIANGKLPPWMSLNILLWFDAITLDGKSPSTVDDVLMLTRLDAAERPKRTKCRLGPQATDPDAEPFRGFLKVLYVAWSRDLEVMIDS